jgi:serine/threonine-protein kinase
MGHDVTGQSDLYSLGVVLYEMLVGDVPFKGETQVAVAMKHVREELPDVQSSRPEVSAAVAAVVERATDKDLSRRYADDDAIVADLENALTVEAARAGATTGEATSVLRTLPDSTRRRLPLRMRHPWWIVGALALAGAIAVAIVIGAGNQAERGTGRAQAQAPPGLHAVSLGQRAAKDYDPAGDDEEHTEEASFVLDRNPTTTWSTEQYEGGVLNKAGVGIYVDAEPGTAARRITIETLQTGWTAEIYAAPSGPPEQLSGWRRVSGSAVSIDEKTKNVALDTAGQQFRYYLVWIKKLPPSGKVEISEIRLFD